MSTITKLNVRHWEDRNTIETVIGYAADLIGCDTDLAKHVIDAQVESSGTYTLLFKGCDPLRKMVVVVDHDADCDGERYRDQSKATRVEVSR